MRPLRTLGWAALVTLLLPLLAFGQPAQPTPTPSGAEAEIVEHVELGFSGWLPDYGVGPVWITLKNTSSDEQRLRVVTRARGAKHEQKVDLPAAGRARVFLTIRTSWRLSVEVYREAELLFRREYTNTPTMDSNGHLLVIDGRPAERQKGPATSKGAPGGNGYRWLQITRIEPQNAALESACYQGMGGVLLRAVDPGELSPGQRAALLEYTLLGGHLYLAAEGPDRPKVAQFLKLIGGKDEKVKLMGRPALQRNYGLGQIVTFSRDFVEDLSRSERLRTEFRTVLQGDVRRSRLGPTYERFGGIQEHPGAGTFGMVVIFFAIYWLIVGPGIAIGLRRARRRTLGTFAVAAIFAFCALAFVVAGTVRTATGKAHVREAVLVSADGVSIGVTDVTVVSGGAWRYDLLLESKRPFAATTIGQSGRRKLQAGWSTDDVTPTSARTQRGRKVELDLRPAPWDQRSVHVVQERPDLAPIEARLVGGSPRGKGYEVLVKNTSRVEFGPAIVVEDVAHQLGLAKAYASLGVLKPGEEKRVFLRPGARIRGATLPSYKGKHWFTELELPSSWRGWANLRNTSTSFRNQLNVRFVVLSRIPNAIDASGGSLDVEAHAIRIDPVEIGDVFERGYMGVELELKDTPMGKQVAVTTVVKATPAERAGLQGGDIVVAVEGVRGTVQPQTVDELIQEVGRHRPGETVILHVQRGGNPRPVPIRVRLGRRRDFTNR